MSRRGWFVLGLCLLTLTQFGCQTSSRDRLLRQPAIEEYNLPPSDPSVAEGPYYPEQKRQLPSQAREQEKALGMAGRAGGGMGGAGGPSGLNGNGAPNR
jgi:hypothetical protein